LRAAGLGGGHVSVVFVRCAALRCAALRCAALGVLQGMRALLKSRPQTTSLPADTHPVTTNGRCPDPILTTPTPPRYSKLTEEQTKKELAHAREFGYGLFYNIKGDAPRWVRAACSAWSPFSRVHLLRLAGVSRGAGSAAVAPWLLLHCAAVGQGPPPQAAGFTHIAAHAHGVTPPVTTSRSTTSPFSWRASQPSAPLPGWTRTGTARCRRTRWQRRSRPSSRSVPTSPPRSRCVRALVRGLIRRAARTRPRPATLLCRLTAASAALFAPSPAARHLD
jgi:hypothetical protein